MNSFCVEMMKILLLLAYLVIVTSAFVDEYFEGINSNYYCRKNIVLSETILRIENKKYFEKFQF